VAALAAGIPVSGSPVPAIPWGIAALISTADAVIFGLEGAGHATARPDSAPALPLRQLVWHAKLLATQKKGEETVAEDEPEPPGGPDGGRPEQPGEPELLQEMAALRRQARTARHAYWFPLVLFGLLTCGSFPFYLRSPAGRPSSGGAVLASLSNPGGKWLPFLGGVPGAEHGGLAYYWLAALLGGLLATLLWYRWHARRAGLATPALGYIICTAVLTVAAVVIPPLSLVRSPHWLSFLHPLRALWPGDLIIRGVFPLVIIAVGLLVLAWAERSLALAITAAFCVALALAESLYNVGNIAYRLGWSPSEAIVPLLNVLPSGLFLLVAGMAALLWQRRRRATA
jgi:hypothetical protein